MFLKHIKQNIEFRNSEFPTLSPCKVWQCYTEQAQRDSSLSVEFCFDMPNIDGETSWVQKASKFKKLWEIDEVLNKGLDNWVTIWEKIKTDPYLTPFPKLNSKWIRDLNVKKKETHKWVNFFIIWVYKKYF